MKDKEIYKSVKNWRKDLRWGRHSITTWHRKMVIPGLPHQTFNK